MSPLVAHVVGARPNYMKVAPLYVELERLGGLEQRLVHTGQHYDASVNEVFFSELPLPEPHIKLKVRSGSHGAQTARALAGLERTFMELEPDLVVVPGDVNSTLAAALAAVKLGIPVCHLEAGLRSFDWAMPEEHNRKLTDHVSSLLLTHCAEADENLAAEGIPADRIACVGNTMIDTLLQNVERARALTVWDDFGLAKGDYVLVTLHRPALVDDARLLTRSVAALGTVAEVVPVVFPVHPRTRARIRALGLQVSGRIRLVEPQPYSRFLSLEAAALAVVTDSGGVQEETTALGVRCFTLRDNTERPVTVSQGTNIVLGLDPDRLASIPKYLELPLHDRTPPLWDGRAGERAAAAVRRTLALGVADGPGAADAAALPGAALVAAKRPRPF
jgi:UDP-N-acetylglucosamine 2-epimerase (non-hydrolysing)